MIGSFLPVCLKDKDTIREKVTKFVLLRPGASAGISPRRDAGRVALQAIPANLALLLQILGETVKNRRQNLPQLQRLSLSVCADKLQRFQNLKLSART
jgi:hypothetical protein